MAEEYKSGGKNTDSFVSARAEVSAATLDGTPTAVTFTNAQGDTFTVFDCNVFTNLSILAEATTQDADVQPQVRNADGDTWFALATATTVSAGAVDSAYDGAIRYRYLRVLASDTLTAGASVDISVCLK